MNSISPAALRFLRSVVRNELPSTRPAATCSQSRRMEGRVAAQPRCAAHPERPGPAAYGRSPRRHFATRAPRCAQGAASFTSVQEEAPAAARAPQTYYELFPKTLPNGPPPAGLFSIDLRTLRNEFLQLQAKAHPDLHSGENKRRAEATSSLINEAYKTLQDPLRRAQYLLSLRGLETDKDEAAKLGGDAASDHELLMTVMEVNETVEEATEQGEVDELKTANNERIAASVDKLGELFAADQVEAAQKEAIRLRYWMNIKQSLDEWEPGKPVVLVH